VEASGEATDDPEGLRLSYPLSPAQAGMARRLGKMAREFVRHHFLITRKIRDYLTLMILRENPIERIMEL
jgi:hypothetical protein